MASAASIRKGALSASAIVRTPARKRRPIPDRASLQCATSGASMTGASAWPIHPTPTTENFMPRLPSRLWRASPSRDPLATQWLVPSSSGRRSPGRGPTPSS